MKSFDVNAKNEKSIYVKIVIHGILKNVIVNVIKDVKMTNI